MKIKRKSTLQIEGCYLSSPEKWMPIEDLADIEPPNTITPEIFTIDIMGRAFILS